MEKKQFFEISISVIIPAYNEEENINYTLNKFANYLTMLKYTYEIIVVDDGSNDNTSLVVEDFIKKDKNVFLLKNGNNKGKGYAVKKGILNSRGQYIFFTDATLFYHIKEIDKLLKMLEKYEIAIASRFHPEAKVQTFPHLHRRILSYIFNLFAQLIAPGILDTQCGLKGFRKGVALDIFNKQTIPGFGFDVEIIYLAQKKKYRIIEVPIESIYSHSPRSKVRLLRDSFRTLTDLGKITINDWFGKYNDVQQFYERVVNYYDIAALQREGYYDKRGTYAFKYQARLKKIISTAIKADEDSKNGRILDLGCGRGDFSLELSKVFPSDKVIGMDFSSEMLKLSSISLEQNKNIKFVQGDFTKIPFIENTFDLVVCVGVTCCIHPSGIEKAITELARVTKGTVVLEIKNKLTPFYLFRKFEPIINKSKLPVYGNTTRQIERQLSRYGFKLTKIIPIFKFNFISPSIILKFTKR